MRDYSFGNFLHEQRLRTGLTQYQLGTLVGVSDKAVSKWENGSSKPKTDILYKLSETLCISIDELLTCKYHTLCERNKKGVFAMKNKIWDKAYSNMQKCYGENTHLEIVNRFHKEKALLQNTDIVVYFNIIGQIVSESKKQNEYIRIRNEIGASFVAYLLGVTDINPLRPHYFCKHCQKIVFANQFECCLDLPAKSCLCGETIYAEGFNIPFECYSNVFTDNLQFGITTSQAFYNTAKSILKKFLNNNEITANIKDEKYLSVFSINSKTKCSITLCAEPSFDKLKSLEIISGIDFDTIDCYTNNVLQEFKNGNTSGIPWLNFNFVKNLISEISPNSFGDLLKIHGFVHGAGVWTDNIKRLEKHGVGKDKMFAFKEDVFIHIHSKMIQKNILDYGFAYKIMQDVSSGQYFKFGIPENIKRHLDELDVEDWFVSSVKKTQFLFSKSNSCNYVKLAAILMWYKINYPKAFSKTMLN